MLPVANLDYELEAQAQLGVAGSGTSHISTAGGRVSPTAQTYQAHRNTTPSAASPKQRVRSDPSTSSG